MPIPANVRKNGPKFWTQKTAIGLGVATGAVYFPFGTAGNLGTDFAAILLGGFVTNAGVSKYNDPNLTYIGTAIISIHSVQLFNRIKEKWF